MLFGPKLSTTVRSPDTSSPSITPFNWHNVCDGFAPTDESMFNVKGTVRDNEEELAIKVDIDDVVLSKLADALFTITLSVFVSVELGKKMLRIRAKAVSRVTAKIK